MRYHANFARALSGRWIPVSPLSHPSSILELHQLAALLCARTGKKRSRTKSTQDKERKVCRHRPHCVALRTARRVEQSPKADNNHVLFYPFFLPVDLSFFCLRILDCAQRQRGGRSRLLSFFLIEKIDKERKKEKKRATQPRARTTVCLVREGVDSFLLRASFADCATRSVHYGSRFAFFFKSSEHDRGLFSLFSGQKEKRGCDWAVFGCCVDGPRATDRAAADSTSRANRPAGTIF